VKTSYLTKIIFNHCLANYKNQLKRHTHVLLKFIIYLQIFIYTGCFKTAPKTLQDMIKYAAPNNKSLKK
jgi:hypothetical protein